MRKTAPLTVTAALVASMFLVTGCEALVGGAVGAGATGGGYEVHLDQNKKKVQDDYEAGRIDEEEYRIRIDQIERDSFIQ